MGNKEYLLKKAKEMAEEEARRKKDIMSKGTYRPWSMVVRMPLGCWIWIAGAVALAVYLIKRML